MDELTDDKALRIKAEQAELAHKWLAEITRVRGKEEKWRKQANKVILRYRDDREYDNNASRFNILWSNTEVIEPAIFSRSPIPDVRRRWSTKDPASRTAALIIERSLSFINSSYNLIDVLNRARSDYVLPGRGIVMVCYEPMILNRQVRKPVEPDPPSTPPEDEPKYPEGTEFDDQGAYMMQPEEYKAWESVYAEYVPWDLFGFSECKSWATCPAMWVGDYLSKADIEKLCPDFKDYQNLQFKSSDDNESTLEKNSQPPQTILIWKVWHKSSRKFMIFAEGYTTAPLRMVDDPLELENFFPCPEPLYSIRTNGSWMPKPEFLLYQDQANELDIIAERMRSLISACKVRGVYDQAMDSLAKISEIPNKPDNSYIPIPGFRELADKGGLEALLSSMPLDKIIEALQQLRERETELKQQIYELYGIADIMRGASVASETLGAQQLKAQYGALRISTRQQRFQDFIREIFRIEAEIICEHFDPNTLRIMCGLQVIPDMEFEQMKQQKQLEAGMISESEFNQAIQIIRSDKLRGFKVDIETDSTVPVDKESEQQNRIAFVTAIGTYLQGVIPAVQSGAIPASVAREAMLFVVRGFKIGSELEEVLEQLGDSDDGEDVAKMKQMLEQLQQQLQQLQQENQDLKANTAVELKKAEVKGMIDQQSAEQSLAIKAKEAELASAGAQNDVARDLQLKQMELEAEMQIAREKEAAETARLQMKLENDRLIAAENHKVQLLTAQMSVQSSQSEVSEEAEVDEPKEDLGPAIMALIGELGRPKTVIRGPDGKVQGIE